MIFQHRVASRKWDMLKNRGAQSVCEGEDWIWFCMPTGPDGLIDSWGKVSWHVNDDLEEES